MNLFNKFKTLLHTNSNSSNSSSSKQQQKYPVSEIVEPKRLSNKLHSSSDSYDVILMDIVEQINKDVQMRQSNKKYSEQIYEDLVFEEEQHEEMQNIYIKDFIFVNRLEEPKQLTVQQWNAMIQNTNMSLSPKKNIYFSIFKGIKFEIRKKVWQLFANTNQMKKLTTMTYKQMINPQNIKQSTVIQIDKDVPRTASITKYSNQLRNVLIGYCTLTGKQYVQGMNLIAGALLTLLGLENDEELSEFEIVEKGFEERVFWIFIGVMVWKNWQDIFDKDFAGLTKRLQTLECLMVEHVPLVYQKLIDYEWDLTIFSQYYITIMLYNSPREFSKIILDLFFLDGENAIHSLMIRMMKMQQDKIVGFKDQCELMSYFKKQIILDCYTSVIRNKEKAKKLQDFQINFIKSSKG